MTADVLYLVQQTITRTARRFPEHEAMRCRGASLTYAELERRSNGLARLLVEYGVRRGDRVGIYAHKCLELAIGIYGALKAGAAYVPLDPTAPAPRLRKILRNCTIRHLVTHEPKRKAVRALLGEDNPVRFCIGMAPGDDLSAECLSWEDVRGAAADDPPQTGTIEQDLAYVLYTSGSTGEPKGIMHTHRSALSFAEVAARTYGFSRHDRLSNHAPLHFDLSTLDFFASAVAGATTIIIPEEYTKLPASLSELIAAERMTVLYTVPLALIQLLLHGALSARDLSHLRWVLFGGEPFPTKHLRRLMGLLPQARFSNVYGPTEVNGCTYYLVPELPEHQDEAIPIGRLYENAEALVVDEQDRSVPPGVPGELLIRSATRMEGYWGDPALTERATYRRPTPGGGEEFFHRTGDLVQLQPDGDFKLLGRKDRQIKTRGHRVELDEVEAALVTHELVEEAAAYALPDGEGSQKIEAAIILTGQGRERPSDLLRHVRGQLPPYAVPSRIEVRESFPRTTTGKIDRRRLREQALETAASADPK